MVPKLVSVVIVSYNNWPDLELAIQSALHQSYRPVEVIVVDNSSSDATSAEVPIRFGDVVRYIRQPNAGMTAGGYNTGMRVAKGEFIQFVDGDDFLAPDKIEKQVAAFLAEPAVDILYGDWRHFQSRPGVVRNWEDPDIKHCNDILGSLLSPFPMRLSTQAMLYRRSALDKIGDWDETVYITDVDYWVRAAWLGCRFQYCPGSLAFRRIRPGQMSSDAEAMDRGYEAVWSKALEYVSREPYRSGILAKLAYYHFQIAMSVNGLTTREALKKLSQARAASPEAIPFLKYALAYCIVLLPGGREFVRRPWFRALFRWAKRLVTVQNGHSMSVA